MGARTPRYHTPVLIPWFRQLSFNGLRGKWRICALLLGVSVAGCAGTGPFTWYTELPKKEWDAITGEYVIGIGDTISIRVYEQEGVSGSFKIRRDGRIALPLAGEIMAAGKHPSELGREIEVKLKQFIVAPKATVNIDSSQPVTITTIGEISHIGTLTLEQPAQLIQAIAQSGGPSDYADKSKIFVMRQYPTFRRIRFTYDAILHNEAHAAIFPMQTGDVIQIE